MYIYMDNAATTKVCDESAKAVMRCLNENYGNPSSLHRMGINAQKTVDTARRTIGAALVCEPDNIIFTSGATESNNLAILGAISIYGKRKKRIVTTSIEHPSVNECMAYLESTGFEVIKISPDRRGNIDCEEFLNAVNDNTCFVSVMIVNNETGYISPVKKIFYSIKKKYPDIIIHCDLVQGFMKIPIKSKELMADLISVSGHKIYGPKGIGALYIKKGVRLAPRSYGGKQEKGHRSGTESVPLIAGFEAAVAYLSGTIENRYTHAVELKKYLLEKLQQIGRNSVNSNEDSLPYIINISVEGIRSEILLHYLEEKGIYVSSGSACSKGAKSSVLKEFGLSDKLIDSALRISTCSDNTLHDMDVLSDAISDAQKRFLQI